MHIDTQLQVSTGDPISTHKSHAIKFSDTFRVGEIEAELPKDNTDDGLQHHGLGKAIVH